MHRYPACCALVLLLPGSLHSQLSDNRLSGEVVATASEFVPHSRTISSAGHSFSDCAGTTSYFAQFNGDFASGSGRTNISCSTISYPVTESTYTVYHRIIYTVLKTDRALYLVSCTQKFRWSRCPAFAVGAKFVLAVDTRNHSVLLDDGTGSKPSKVDYVSSIAVPSERREGELGTPLPLTLGGFLQNGLESEKVDGVCGTDATRNELRCDVYNGLKHWKLVEITVRVVWSPYTDEHKRDFVVAASIAPMTTQQISTRLGMQLPEDETVTVREKQTVVRKWQWQTVAAKGIPAQ